MLQYLNYFRLILNRLLMNVKIDTKEKFTVITLNDENLPANMTGELGNLLLNYLDAPMPHVILNFKNVNAIAPEIFQKIAELRANFQEKDSSFVVCEIRKELLAGFDGAEDLNITPTESEAWDIIQMEEIERELLADDENE